MEKEPKIERGLAEKLRERYKIERAELSDDESLQCSKCISENNNFKFYNEGWFIEGEFYCPNHKEDAIKVLEEVDNDVERRRLEQERIIEERRKQSGLK